MSIMDKVDMHKKLDTSKDAPINRVQKIKRRKTHNATRKNTSKMEEMRPVIKVERKKYTKIWK